MKNSIKMTWVILTMGFLITHLLGEIANMLQKYKTKKKKENSYFCYCSSSSSSNSSSTITTTTTRTTFSLLFAVSYNSSQDLYPRPRVGVGSDYRHSTYLFFCYYF